MNLLPATGKVFIRKEPTDMRWGIDRLFWEVKRSFGADPYEGSLFLFYSRTGNRVKILHWDRGGFVLYYKRLERGRFRIPVDGSMTQLDSPSTRTALPEAGHRALPEGRRDGRPRGGAGGAGAAVPAGPVDHLVSGSATDYPYLRFPVDNLGIVRTVTYGG